MESIKRSSYSLIRSVLHNKSFKHPNQEVIKGSYEFVRFNPDDGTVALDNLKTGKRVNVSKNTFDTMETPITESFLEAVINGASRNYKKPFGLKLIRVLDRETGDVGFNQIRPEEIGTKYTLIKGESNLYEQTQPLCTEDITKGPYDPRQTHHPCKID